MHPEMLETDTERRIGLRKVFLLRRRERKISLRSKRGDVKSKKFFLFCSLSNTIHVNDVDSIMWANRFIYRKIKKRKTILEEKLSRLKVKRCRTRVPYGMRIFTK